MSEYKEYRIKYAIDCRKLTDPKAAHAYLKELFNFPDYYGSNLDALYDCLTELPTCEISLEYPWALQQLGDYAPKLLSVFTDIAAEFKRVELV